MRKLVTLGLAVMFLVAGTTAFPPPAQAQAAGLVSSIINRMDRNRREMRSLRSGVWMQKYNAQIRQEDNYVGEVQYVAGSGRNGNVRVDWQKPVNEILAVKNGKYTLLKPRMKTAYVGSTNSRNAKVSSVLGFGLNVSRAQLAANFEPVQVLGEGTLNQGGPHVWWLKLVPKGNASYKHMEVWVDDSGMPLQTRVVERNNDMTTVRLLNPQKNARVPSEAFDLQLGSDIKVIKG